MKKLYLHIGCGKTGSSALQVWLSQNIEDLHRNGFNYYLVEKLHEYEISSGNGKLLVEKLRNATYETFLNELFEETDNVLFSSEIFQTLSNDELSKLKNFCMKSNIQIQIIAYIRDVYDVLYSEYLQGVKRSGYENNFEYFINNVKNIYQFSVLEKFEKFFNDIVVLHYDSEKKRGLENSFCEALGINTNSLKEMSRKKVNRSLSLVETEFLRLLNKIHNNQSNKVNNQFGINLSNKMIYANPEKDVELYFDQNIIVKLKNRFQSKVNLINDKYFLEDRLKIFDSYGKNVTANKVEYIDELFSLLSILYKDLKDKKENLISQTLNVELVNYLRDSAIDREKNNLEEACILMKAASILRPNGPLIKEKVEKYQQQIKQ